MESRGQQRCGVLGAGQRCHAWAADGGQERDPERVQGSAPGPGPSLQASQGCKPRADGPATGISGPILQAADARTVRIPSLAV